MSHNFDLRTAAGVHRTRSVDRASPEVVIKAVSPGSETLAAIRIHLDTNGRGSTAYWKTTKASESSGRRRWTDSLRIGTLISTSSTVQALAGTLGWWGDARRSDPRPRRPQDLARTGRRHARLRGTCTVPPTFSVLGGRVRQLVARSGVATARSRRTGERRTRSPPITAFMSGLGSSSATCPAGGGHLDRGSRRSYVVRYRTDSDLSLLTIGWR